MGDCKTRSTPKQMFDLNKKLENQIFLISQNLDILTALEIESTLENYFDWPEHLTG